MREVGTEHAASNHADKCERLIHSRRQEQKSPKEAVHNEKTARPSIGANITTLLEIKEAHPAR